MQKWEYMSLSVYEGKGDKWVFDYSGRTYPESERTLMMSQMGQQGWELVSVLPFQGFKTGFNVTMTYTNSYTLFFKRPVSS